MYDSYLKINKKFKASVNLEYDLLNEEKIEQYVPTSDLCDVLKSYIKSVLYGSNFNSTILSGPYGKGKSFLMLVLVYLLSKRENKTLLNSLLKKIKLVDDELYNLVLDLEEKEYYLYPVIINNNVSDDINKTFIFALNNMLNTYNITDIIPNTTFNECLKIINTWESQSNTDFDLSVCLKTTTIDKIKDGLSNCDYEAYKKFTDLYTCVSKGLEFFSMKTDDMVSIYIDVIDKLVKRDSKCKGLFVLFDEFGSFLTSQTNDFALKLSKIQSFAEKANASDLEHQLHLCCVTHKDILLYKKEKTYSDAFETIAGRFKQIRFDRSLEENYQLICSALLKEADYSKLLGDIKSSYDFLFNGISEIGIFSDKQLDYIINNGIPFNPLTLYCLIQVSEKIAQNERTLFTFLSDKDINGFRYFIANNDTGLLNVDSIYDYFSALIKDSEEYKMLFYKVESLINSTLKVEEHKLFKVIAIFKIINDVIKLNSTIKNLSLALGIRENECNNLINSLVNNNTLKKNINDNSIDFAIIADDEINDMINNILETKFSNLELSRALTEINPYKYEFSNEYNFTYNMMRFFKVIYFETSMLPSIVNMSSIFKELIRDDFADGIIINLINNNNLKNKELKELIAKCPHNIIFKMKTSKMDKQFINKIKTYYATKYIYENNKNLSSTALNALPILLEDLYDEIKTYLFDQYGSLKCFIPGETNLLDTKKAINLALVKTYPSTIKFNNEQVNKQEIATVTAKARNNVVDYILGLSDFNYRPTSQEATIKTAFELAENLDNVINHIKYIISLSNGERKKFNMIIPLLLDKPYGIRKGLIPLILARAISDLSITTENHADTVLIYNGNTEIDLNAINLAKIVENPTQFSFVFTTLSATKIESVLKLSNLFHIQEKNNLSDLIKELVFNLKKYISNLEPLIIKAKKNDNVLELSEKALRFKEEYLCLNTNSYELLFDITPRILECGVNELYANIQSIMKEYSNKVKYFKENIINNTLNMFDSTEGSLKSAIDYFIQTNPQINCIIFENKDKAIYDSLIKSTFDDFDLVNQLSRSAVNCSVVDWNTNKLNAFNDTIISFIKLVKEFNTSNALVTKSDIEENVDNKELSFLGETLLSNIQNTIEEYGDAISNEEKVIIFRKILSNYM